MAKATKAKRATATRQLLLPIRLLLRVLGGILSIVFWPLRPLTRPAMRYLRGVRQEFRKVSWPSRKETWRLTFSVVIFSVVFAAFVAVVDYGLGILFEKVIVKG